MDLERHQYFSLFASFSFLIFLNVEGGGKGALSKSPHIPVHTHKKINSYKFFSEFPLLTPEPKKSFVLTRTHTQNRKGVEKERGEISEERKDQNEFFGFVHFLFLFSDSLPLFFYFLCLPPGDFDSFELFFFGGFVVVSLFYNPLKSRKK